MNDNQPFWSFEFLSPRSGNTVRSPTMSQFDSLSVFYLLLETFFGFQFANGNSFFDPWFFFNIEGWMVDGGWWTGTGKSKKPSFLEISQITEYFFKVFRITLEVLRHFLWKYQNFKTLKAWKKFRLFPDIFSIFLILYSWLFYRFVRRP